MRKRSFTKFLAALLLLAQLFSLTAGITVFAATPGPTIQLEPTPRPTPVVTPEPTPELTPPPESELVPLPEPYTRRFCSYGQIITMGGDVYENSIDFTLGTYAAAKNASAYYNLDGKYSLINFDAGYINGKDRAGYLEVYGDGELLLETGKLGSNDLPRNFTVNVEGVRVLRLLFTSDGYETNHYGVGNIRGVLVSDLDSKVYESDPFYDLDCYKKSAALVNGDFKMAGKNYKDGYEFSVGGYIGVKSKNVIFNFRKQYQEMTFDIAKYNGDNEDRKMHSITMTIEADGVVIPEYDNVTIAWNELALPVTVDLTGVSQLTITVRTNEYETTSYRMSNIQLKSNGVVRGIKLDATPVSNSVNYTAELTDKAPEIALNPRVYPSDAPQEYTMDVTAGADCITVTEDGVVTAIHKGNAVINFSVPDTDISVDCAITSKVTAHVWNDGEVTKEPTLDKQGEKLFTCTVCEQTKTEKIDKLTECEEHTWNDGEITKEPSYTEEGEKLLTCTVCGKTETQVVDQLTCAEHAWDEGKTTKEPSYTEEGKKLFTCTTCGETKTEILSKLVCEEHTWDNGVIAKEPTTEAEGERLFTCTTCSETKTEPIAKIPTITSETVPLPAPYNKRSVDGPQELSMGGITYTDGLQFKMGYNSGGDTTHAVINLDGKFSAIAFDASFVSGDQRNGYLTVRGDGKVLLDAAEINPSDIPREFALDVTGVKQLKFSYNSGGYDGVRFGLGNLRGVLVEELDTNVYRSDEFFDLNRYQLDGSKTIGEFEIGGKKYENGYTFTMGYNAGKTKSVSFNFKGQYKEMTFDVAKYTSSKSDNYGHTISMTIKVDGVPVPEYENVALTWDALVLPVKLDLTGASQVTITFHNGAYDSASCSMGNIQFKSDGKVHGLLLDATPVSGSVNYTANLTDKAPEIALNPRVYPSDVPQEYVMTVTGDEYIDVTEDGIVTALHKGDAVINFTVPNTDISVDCVVASKVSTHIWDQGTVTKEPTVNEQGEKLFACTVCEQTQTEKIDKLTECAEHKWDDGKVITQPSYNELGEKLFTCTNCGETKTEPMDFLECTEHKWDDGKVITQPSYNAPGEILFTCVNCGETKMELMDMLECTKHIWDEGKVITQPSYNDFGEILFTCTNCGETKNEPLDFLTCTEHKWDNGKVITEPTYDEPGEKLFTCINCGETKVEPMDFLTCTEHKWNDGEVITKPSYTEFGEMLFTCTNCGETKNEPIDMLECTKHIWDEGKLIKEPTYTESGERLFTCTVCASTLSEVLPQLTPENPFEDVSENDWFYEPVIWAYTNNVTGGVAADMFGPYASCTRGQVVTFLWAAAGKPAPTSTNNPFEDVASTDYYYNAVLWAVENGITSGIAPNLFGPDQSCTRGQIVTFLWAANGRPEPSLSMNPFIDFDSSAYYYKPILWAVQYGITTGIGDGMFGPENTCTRCQIVTFLYKASQVTPKPEVKPTPTPAPEETPTPTPEVTPAPQLALVTDAYTEAFQGQYNAYHCYHIPQINLPNDLAKEWNEQIFNKLMETIEKRVHKEMEKYNRPSQGNMIYNWGQKDHLVSIVLREDETEYDWTALTFYTVSTTTGKQVENSEIYAAYGMTEEDFYEAVKIVLAAVMAEKAEYYKDILSAEMIQELIDSTLSEKNIKESVPFINTEGKLCFKGATYSPAGAGRYWSMWTMEGDNVTVTCPEHKK